MAIGHTPAIAQPNEILVLRPYALRLGFGPVVERSFDGPAMALIQGISGTITKSALPAWLIVVAALIVLTGLLFRALRRQLALRRERDAALIKIETLEALSERDPLTGLLNRARGRRAL